MIPILLYHILYLLSIRSFSWAAQNIKKDRVVTLSPGSICTRIVVPSEQFIGQRVAHPPHCGLILTSLLHFCRYGVLLLTSSSPLDAPSTDLPG